MYKRPVSKKDIDEKKRKEESEQEAAKAFQEFVQVFDNKPTSQGKVWVKAGTFNAGSKEETTQDKGKLYIPKSRFEPLPEKSDLEPPKAKQDKPNSSKKKEPKKKSNLEIFKDELKKIQEEREERQKMKSQIGVLAQMLSQQQQQQQQQQQPEQKSSDLQQPQLSLPAVVAAALRPGAPELSSLLSLETNSNGSFDNGDPSTTNLYLGNLAPSMTEQRLMEVFGKFGALASIKIMWPRTEDERQRGRNCGFVAFMNRPDAESAIESMSGKDVDGFEMKMGWGKSVPLPQVPIFVPPALLAKLDKPPPFSGLPFNAQPRACHRDKFPHAQPGQALDDEQKQLWTQMLQKAVVKVVVPTDRLQLQTINRCIEFVIREGPLFEAIIMGRETTNPQYKFLYDNTCPEHVYYRWKLFSMLHGDTVSRWNTDRFRMFKGGSIWEPPKLNPYANNPAASSRRMAEDARAKGLLSDSQRKRFESQLRHMTPERRSVGEVMVWCLDHAESADEICNCITESLSNIATKLSSKIARLYLVCDLLHNSSARVSKASKFRNCIQDKLPEIFDHLNKTLTAQQEEKQQAQVIEAFKQRVLRVLTAWEESAVYQLEFLIALQTTFLGLTLQPPEPVVPENPADSGGQQQEEGAGSGQEDVDGAPLSDSDNSDVDGVPLDGAILLKKAAAVSSCVGAAKDGNEGGEDEEEDVDGVPLEESVPAPAAAPAATPVSGGGGGFVPSRWETVDPDDVAAGVVTTSKWDQLTTASGPDDQQEEEEPSVAADDDDVDGVPMKEETAGSEPEAMSPESVAAVSEERRQKLREVELKAMAYQDDLESGQRPVKSGYTLLEQVDHYRNKLMKKVDRQIAEGRKRRSNHLQQQFGSEGRDPGTPGDHVPITDLTVGSPSSASSYPLSAAAGSGSVGSISVPGSRSRRRSRSRSSDCDRAKRSRRRSRSRSPSRRRRRSRSPVMSSSSSRRSRSPRHRSRSPASYRSRSRSPSRKSSRRKSRR